MGSDATDAAVKPKFDKNTSVYFAKKPEKIRPEYTTFVVKGGSGSVNDYTWSTRHKMILYTIEVQPDPSKDPVLVPEIPEDCLAINRD